MMPPDHDAPEEIAWQGDWITAKTRGRWEYVSRARGIRAAVILPIDNGDVILVEQYRIPLSRNCLELPAGLVGDSHENGDESADLAATRELEEETGYHAEHWENCGEFFSSPGMVSESFTLLKATGLKKVSEGGGVEGENITVHRVPLTNIREFITEKRKDNVAIDVKLLLLLAPYLLSK
ncbi:NUDIX hydrolase [Altericroceibacterium spongiae]|uniref:GDP-mannose pyrophosphatase n=1 Tax=Altericroceibacterium spongiae TaxID=2320269 RepID=A0A420ERB2_9SPHN|nr:NUDIX hydrolase [Altericroceibacterium spongiae]RKF23163.1 NUDIX hydrolase [Altericroceibacterium spongiae]